MKKVIALAFLASLVSGGAFAQATTSLNVTVPGSGTGFDFDSAVSSTAPYWPLVRLWDGTNKMAINPNGQATAGNSQPVVLPQTQVTQDPCALQTKTPFNVSSTSAEFVLVSPAAVKQVYICSLFIQPSATDTISIVGGLAPTCTTGTPIAIIGSTTAANGADFLASSGLNLGNGAGTIYSTTTSGHGVCLLHTGTGKVVASGTFVQI